MKAKPSTKPGEIVLELGRSDSEMLATAALPPGRPRFALSNILVPIDFSECSRKALRYAIPFAKEHGATLTLAYIVPKQYARYDYGGPDMPSLEAEMFVDGEKRLKEMIATEVPAEIRAEEIVRVGAAADEIVNVARNVPADLIVISTHGHTGLRHIFLGSVAEHVVRTAPCPVLVVREKENEFIVE